MNNPDDQTVPSPPNTIPVVVNSGDTSNPPPPSPPNTIPIVVDQDDAGKQPPPPSGPSTIPIVVDQDDAGKQPPPPSEPSTIPIVDQDDAGKQPPLPPPVPLETVLIAKGLNKYSVDGTAELKDVSFELLKGQLTCIMGRDEDGVSSLLRVLALEEPVTSGSLTILKKETSGLSIGERNTLRDTHIAYIRQSHLGLIEQTGHILVAYWLHYYDELSWNEALETASQALKEVGITHHRGNMAIKELSIPEVARVSIAKAYARCRRHRCIYLFDDLFISLDQTPAVELAQLLHAAARQGKVGSADSGKVIVAQTNRQDITSIFDQVLEMRDGELLRVR